MHPQPQEIPIPSVGGQWILIFPELHNVIVFLINRFLTLSLLIIYVLLNHMLTLSFLET